MSADFLWLRIEFLFYYIVCNDKGRKADEKPDHKSCINIGGEMNEQVKPWEGLDNGQGDSKISKSSVRKGKNDCRDGGGERVSRGERKIAGIFNK